MIPLAYEIRTAVKSDAEYFWRLGHEAFGFPTTAFEPDSLDRPGATAVVAMDGNKMAGRMIDLNLDCWFGGKLVPTSGIGGVTVAMEYRGQGLLTQLLRQVLRTAKDRGAVLSGLYATSAGIYRRFGYEVICTATASRFPISALSRISTPHGVHTRRATAADVPAIRQVYDLWASGNNGPLSRRGACFPAEDDALIKSVDGVTIAEQDDAIIGYTSWNRGQTSGPDGTLEVLDLIAIQPDGYRALMAAVGSFSSVVSQVKIENASGLEQVLELFPASERQELQSQPYMLKIIDVIGALQARGYPSVITATVEFGVAGDRLTEGDGHYRLELASGTAVCSRLGDLGVDPAVPVFTPNGLALAYAGSQSPAGIRTIGGLSGTTAHDETFGAVFGGRPVRIYDRY